jgi:phosphoribosylformylglycinamidine synthase
VVRANEALYDYTRIYGVPCISGKDSMKNDYMIGGTKISIPPTLLFSVIARMDDVRRR